MVNSMDIRTLTYPRIVYKKSGPITVRSAADIDLLGEEVRRGPDEWLDMTTTGITEIYTSHKKEIEAKEPVRSAKGKRHADNS
jgi:hypothetical protein